MKSLLDVSVLVALGVVEHSANDRVVRWWNSNPSLRPATSAITELGFVRVISQTTRYGLSVQEVQELLQSLKEPTPSVSWEVLIDALDVAGLPGWVKSGSQTTDGHLMQLAAAHGADLATLDERIPGAFLIP